MLRKAKEYMQQLGAAFIVTGEVVGQRPMSQHKQALNLIEKEADLVGLVLRPLSAKLLPETIPEKENWISRDKLLDFNGRTRRPQIRLAKVFGIQDYPCAAGGCLLTDPQFAKRTKDLLEYGELNLNSIELLKIGRHFRLTPNAKLIVGRDEKENGRLLTKAKENDYLFMPARLAGPSALGIGAFNTELIKLSCRLVSHYCDLDGNLNAEIVCRKTADEKGEVLNVLPIEEERLTGFRI